MRSPFTTSEPSRTGTCSSGPFTWVRTTTACQPCACASALIDTGTSRRSTLPMATAVSDGGAVAEPDFLWNSVQPKSASATAPTATRTNRNCLDAAMTCPVDAVAQATCEGG